MEQIKIQCRQTKYRQAIITALESLGHATNTDLATIIRQSHPNVSDTTIHRATARLAGRGTISLAPPAPGNIIRYDANIKSHDHFQCSICGQLKDADFKDKIIPIIEPLITDCRISGRLTINGICKKCINNKEEI